MSSAPPDSTTGSHGLKRKIKEVAPHQQEKVPNAAKAAKKQEKEQNLERLKVFLESLGFIRETELFERTLAAVTERNLTEEDPLLVCHPEQALGLVSNEQYVVS
jgi:hypothetical protein